MMMMMFIPEVLFDPAVRKFLASPLLNLKINSNAGARYNSYGTRLSSGKGDVFQTEHGGKT